MKYYIPIETNMIDSDAVCVLINRYGMRGYGMYMAIIIELRKHNNYSCGTDSLRAMARKCNVRFAFLLSVIMDFGLFDVEETEDDKIRISSEYVNRVMLPYDEKIRRCKESEAPEVKEHPQKEK
ncbi:DUF4373 domain-containing protein, partial [Bacteroides sp. OttesenSCG-928-N06]|nr:DUF4373 domain-containing protein [Bacteroides sp. OttesenSCG-928-N06]